MRKYFRFSSITPPLLLLLLAQNENIYIAKKNPVPHFQLGPIKICTQHRKFLKVFYDRTSILKSSRNRSPPLTTTMRRKENLFINAINLSSAAASDISLAFMLLSLSFHSS
jgi:hypothetical protein